MKLRIVLAGDAIRNRLRDEIVERPDPVRRKPVRARGYLIGDVGDASRMDYSRALVMYRCGYAAERVRLAHDLHVHIVSPLDGMRPAQLMGAHLVLIVGA